MKTVYFYGDSNTYGFDPTDFFTGRYPVGEIWTTRVEQALKGQFSLTFDGMNGRCIPSASWEMERIGKAMREADLFAVMLGTNDYLSRPDADAVADKMQRFLRNADAGNILLIAPAAIVIPGETRFNTDDGRLSRAFERVAKEEECGFLDALPWNCGLAGDGVHLSLEGHRTFAERMIEYLKRMDLR